MRFRTLHAIGPLVALLAALTPAAAESLATLTIHVTRQGLPLEDVSCARVFVYEPGRRDDPVAQATAGPPLRLRAGTYDVVVRFVKGQVEQQRELDGLDLTGDVEREIDFDVELATLTVKVDRGGAPVPGFLAKIAVYRAGRHDTPIVETRPGATLTLRPGTYDIEAVLRGTEGLTRRWVEAVPVEGDRVETIEFGAEQAAVTITLERGGVPLDRADAGWRVFRPGDREAAVAEAPSGETRNVAAGVYDLGLFYRDDGRVEQRWIPGIELRGEVRRDFDVASVGDRRTVRVQRRGRPLAGTWCSIRPAAGGAASTSSGDGAPVASVRGGAAVELAPGAYEFRCALRRDGLRAETRTTVDVEPETATIDVDLDYEAASLRVLPPRRGAEDSGKIRVLVIADSSRDMGAALGEHTRLEAVRAALDEAIDSLRGTGVRLGLRVFGIAPPEQQACDDSTLLVPVGPLDARSVGRALRYLRPAGRSPIAYSLERAADDLPAGGRNAIVLLAGGRDDCGGDPCRAAAELVRSGIAARIHVLDLAPAADGAPVLGCAGTYRAVGSELELRDTLRAVIREIRRPDAGSVVLLARDGSGILTGASLGERIDLVRGTYDVVVHAGGETWTWPAVDVSGNLEVVAGPGP